MILRNSTAAQTVWGPLVNWVGFKLAWWKVDSQCNTDTGLLIFINSFYPTIFTFFLHPGTRIVHLVSAGGKIMSVLSDMIYNKKKRERGLENRLNWIISAAGRLSIHEAHIIKHTCVTNPSSPRRFLNALLEAFNLLWQAPRPASTGDPRHARDTRIWNTILTCTGPSLHSAILH